jgi:hypothetical protein
LLQEGKLLPGQGKLLLQKAGVRLIQAIRSSVRSCVVRISEAAAADQLALA